MLNIETMQYYYQNKLWTLEQVQKLLDAKKITQDDYKKIIS